MQGFADTRATRAAPVTNSELSFLPVIAAIASAIGKSGPTTCGGAFGRRSDMPLKSRPAGQSLFGLTCSLRAATGKCHEPKDVNKHGFMTQTLPLGRD